MSVRNPSKRTCWPAVRFTSAQDITRCTPKATRYSKQYSPTLYVDIIYLYCCIISSFLYLDAEVRRFVMIPFIWNIWIRSRCLIWFDMIWYGLDMFGPVWLCLNTFSILFGVPSCGQGYYMGHLSRSGALVLRGIGLTAGIALKKWRKKGEIETQTRWDMQILIDLTVSQCLASIPSTNVPTKKQVHREKIRTYWILLNLKNSVTQHLLTSA